MGKKSKKDCYALRAIDALRKVLDAEPAPPAYDGSFGKNLKAAREYILLTQSDLAELAGTQPSAISHFETGRREPSIRNLVKLATALDGNK